MEKSTTQPIVEQFTVYLETAVKRLKFQGIDKASAAFSEVVTVLVMVVLVLLTFILLSITIALLLGQLLNSGWEGFGCVTGFYFLLVIAARLLRVSLQNMFVRLFIQRVFAKK